MALAARLVLLPMMFLAVAVTVAAMADANGSRPTGSGYIAFAATDPLGVSSTIAGIRPDGKDRRLIGSRPSGVRGDWDTGGPAWSPDGSHLAFEEGAFEEGGAIWTMKADGTDARRLTSPEPDFDDREPAWSPDGLQIAFIRERVGRIEEAERIMVMRADGSSVREITRGIHPSWAPDGSRLVFQRLGDNGGIFVMNADGSQPRRLTSPDEVWRDPAWSPTGRQIAVAGDSGIFVMNADGTGLRRLTRVDDDSPAWAPDEKRIAFGRAGAVWVVNLDGTAVRRLSRAAWSFPDPAWSPDGETIAYKLELDTEIFVMRGDGRQLHAVTRNDVYDQSPAWAPDGRHLAFVRPAGAKECCDGQIVVSDRDGRKLRRLTGFGFGGPVRWSPDGRRIAFVRRNRFPSDAYVVNADGSKRRKLIRGFTLSWSPDSRRLVVGDTHATGGGVQLYVVNAARPAERRRIVAAGPDELEYLDVAWSPTGRTIAFSTAGKVCCAAVYVVDADGRRLRKIANRAVSPAWSPDGQWLAFTRPFTRERLWIMRPDGTRQRPLPSGPAINPVWSPDGRQIAYQQSGAEGVRGVWSIRVDGGQPRLLVDAVPDGVTWSGR